MGGHQSSSFTIIPGRYSCDASCKRDQTIVNLVIAIEEEEKGLPALPDQELDRLRTKYYVRAIGRIATVVLVMWCFWDRGGFSINFRAAMWDSKLEKLKSSTLATFEGVKLH